ncbi:hypothetical protein DV737_g2985, partial [Chaetothyriales sp. CBS 132003]
MSPTFHVGQRLSYDGALCTVRYHGPLADLKGHWLGVEWDRPGRGKHDGTHQGERVFACLSKSAKVASFIRPSRTPDLTRKVLEGLEFKYGSGTAAGVYSGADIVYISGKAVEEIGFDKVQRQLGHFEALHIVLLDGLQVTGLTRQDASRETRDAAAQEFAATCPNIHELDLGWNLIEDWQDIADICKYLAKLHILKASGLRLKSLSIDYASAPGTFASIRELELNDTLLTPDQVLQILAADGTDGTDGTNGATAFPQLTTLSLSSNALDGFGTTDSSLVFPTITRLVLDNNHLTSLAALPAISSHFPSLASLSLQGNRIADLSIASPEPMAFPALTDLALSSNCIPTFAALSSLPVLCPNLISLRVSSNPFTATLPASAPFDTSYYLTLARIPSLQMLNYTTITARDRTEGELYYLSVVEKAMRPILASQTLSAAASYASHHYSRYSELCAKYDRANILAGPPPASSLHANAESSGNRPAGSVASRLFSLVYTSTELDPVGETTRKTDNSREEWARWIDGILYRDGAKWKERETEIIDGTRPWGDFLDGGEQSVRIRVEPKDEQWQGKREQWRNAERTSTDGA